MKTLKKILWIIFMLPVLPIVGIPDVGSDAGGDDGGADKKAGGQDGEDKDKEGESDKADKTVSMKQSDLDALLDTQFRKGAKKAQKTDEGAKKMDDDSTKLNNAIREAAEARVQAAMAIKGIKPEKVERAARLINLDDVMVDGKVDKELLDSELDDLLKDFPELKQTADGEQKGFKVGTEAKDKEKDKNRPVQRIF